MGDGDKCVHFRSGKCLCGDEVIYFSNRNPPCETKGKYCPSVCITGLMNQETQGSWKPTNALGSINRTKPALTRLSQVVLQRLGGVARVCYQRSSLVQDPRAPMKVPLHS